MTQDSPAFYTLDRGTITTAASLVAPVDGRYRLLAAGIAPAAIEVDVLLEDLAWRVARTDASIAGSLDDWPRWSRLEVGSAAPPTATLVATDAETGRQLEQAFLGAGWRIHATLFGPEPDIIELGEAFLDPRVDAAVVASPDQATEEAREQLRLIWPRCGSIARMRDDLALVAAGTFSDRPEGIPDGRLFALPAPTPVAATAESPLRDAARQVSEHVRPERTVRVADAAQGIRASAISLAALLEARLDAIGIDAESGGRTSATPDGEVAHAVLADAALLPVGVLRDGPLLQSILRWSASGSDQDVLKDRLRDLHIRATAGHDGDLVGLRLAALRAALERLGAAWDEPGLPQSGIGAARAMVVTGDAFDGIPAPAAALALADTIRQRGAFSVLHDHARLLGPLGVLPVEEDRRRLLGDLMADAFVPLGSAVLTGRAADAGAGGSLQVNSSLGDQRLRLEPDDVRYVDLPPGIDGQLRIEDGQEAGPATTLRVKGGLGGLLVDTRSIPLEMPTASEPRRALLTRWQGPALAGSRA